MVQQGTKGTSCCHISESKGDHVLIKGETKQDKPFEWET